MKKSLVLVLLALAACGQKNGEAGGRDASASASATANAASIDTAPSKADIRKAAELVPANADLAAKYDRSCRTCHSMPDAAAPLTGHTSAWDARFDAKGAGELLESTKAGLNAMPPMGLCNDCTDEELRALTTFMAGRGG